MKSIRHSEDHHGVTKIIGSNLVEIEDGPVTTFVSWGYIEGVTSVFVDNDGNVLF
jgi:hypothetical protein